MVVSCPIITKNSSVMAPSKPLEIAKRTAIFTAIGQIGSMFAGIMMTALNESLHGETQLAGWQWVFIISWVLLSSLKKLADHI